MKSDIFYWYNRIGTKLCVVDINLLTSQYKNRALCRLECKIEFMNCNFKESKYFLFNLSSFDSTSLRMRIDLMILRARTEIVYSLFNEQYLLKGRDSTPVSYYKEQISILNVIKDNAQFDEHIKSATNKKNLITDDYELTILDLIHKHDLFTTIHNEFNLPMPLDNEVTLNIDALSNTLKISKEKVNRYFSPNPNGLFEIIKL